MESPICYTIVGRPPDSKIIWWRLDFQRSCKHNSKIEAYSQYDHAKYTWAAFLEILQLQDVARFQEKPNEKAIQTKGR